MMFDKLTGYFNKKAGRGGVAAAILAGALTGCAATSGLTPLPLTEGEKELSENIFGPEFNTAIVRKYLSEEDNQCSAAKAYGERDIVFYKNYHADDYSDKSAPHALGLFVHEATHSWQAREWSLLKLFRKKCSTYDYELSEDSHFDDFCNEQQAAMVQDYARYFLTARPVFPTRLTNNDDPQALARLESLIERTFPSIAAARARTEDHHPDTLAARQHIEAHRRDNNIKTITKSKCE